MGRVGGSEHWLRGSQAPSLPLTQRESPFPCSFVPLNQQASVFSEGGPQRSLGGHLVPPHASHLASLCLSLNCVCLCVHVCVPVYISVHICVCVCPLKPSNGDFMCGLGMVTIKGTTIIYLQGLKSTFIKHLLCVTGVSSSPSPLRPLDSHLQAPGYGTGFLPCLLALTSCL